MWLCDTVNLHVEICVKYVNTCVGVNYIHLCVLHQQYSTVCVVCVTE